MSREVFGKRGERLDVRPETVTAGPSPRSNLPTARQDWSWTSRAVWGALCSAAVLALFINMQRISDAAPQSIRDSDMPGLFGAPIAVLAAAWFIIIPVWFVSSVVAAATSGRSTPRAFVVGAFVGLAAYFAAIRFL